MSTQPQLPTSSLLLQKANSIPWFTLRGVLFDWAGTTIDFGSLAPVEVVREVFREYGVEVTETEARQPMGKAKIDHLREVLAMPRIAAQWLQKHGQPSHEQVVQDIYRRFLVMQKSVLAKHSDLIPGIIPFVQFLRSQNVKIGSTTGYTRELMDVVLPLAATAGYSPDATVCSDEVAAGRPAPWSNFRAAEQIGIYPMSNILIVDDSLAGIQAGKNAGCYSVAVTTTGNPFGMDWQSFQRLDQDTIRSLHEKAEAEFYAAGADLVVESISVLHALWGNGTQSSNAS